MLLKYRYTLTVNNYLIVYKLKEQLNKKLKLTFSAFLKALGVNNPFGHFPSSF